MATADAAAYLGVGGGVNGITKGSGRLNVTQVAIDHGVRLTKTELNMLTKHLDMNKDGHVSLVELQKAGKKVRPR